jgi:hypothetical protein
MFFLCAAFLPVSLPANDDRTVLNYLEHRGSTTYVIEYRFTPHPDGIEISAEGDNRIDTIRWLNGTGVVFWYSRSKRAERDVKAERSGDSIKLEGTLKGKSVQKTFRLDSAPWFQILGTNIAELLPQGKESKEFWIINPTDLEAHKMEAKRTMGQEIEVGGKKIETFKVHFDAAGPLSAFWGTDFWYRNSDSVFVYSRLPELEGTTITELENPEK